MTTFRPLILGFSLLLAGLVGCGSSGDESKNDSITVFAAASLKKTFTAIGEQFKTDNPGTSVEFNFAGSSDLVTQLVQGAKADVFASADNNNMVKAEQAELVDGKAGQLRVQHADDRHRTREPEAGRLVRGPQQTRGIGGGVRPAGAVRLGDREGRGCHQERS